MANEGYGQQQPVDSESDHNEKTFFVEQYLANNVATSKPVKVIDVQEGDKTVTVQIMVKQMDGNGNVTDHGKIFGVPYVTLQMGTGAVKMTPKAGDVGLMICCDRDISAVKSTKNFAQPGSLRKFSAADGVYLGGFLNQDPQQWVEFTDDGMQLHDKSGNELTSSAAGWNFKGVVTFQNNVQLGGLIEGVNGGTYAGNIHTTGTVTGDAEVKSGSIGLQAHHHTAQGATSPTTPAQA